MSIERINYEKEGYMKAPAVHLVANLPFGEGSIGAEGYGVGGPEAQEAFLIELGRAIRPITHPHTANCVDGRRILRFADGTDDPYALNSYVTHQLAGGLVLATTKAATAADLIIVRDAKDFKTAYLTMYEFLTSLGYKDGGHADCGASKQVEHSVHNQLTAPTTLATLPALMAVPENVSGLVDSIYLRRKRLLESGFYGGWDNGWHEDFLSEMVPENFAVLETDESPTSGHQEKGLLLVTKEGYGFAKNSHNSKTGQQVFAETTHTMPNLAKYLGSALSLSPVEEMRFNVAFTDEGPRFSTL